METSDDSTYTGKYSYPSMNSIKVKFGMRNKPYIYNTCLNRAQMGYTHRYMNVIHEDKNYNDSETIIYIYILYKIIKIHI